MANQQDANGEMSDEVALVRAIAYTSSNATPKAFEAAMFPGASLAYLGEKFTMMRTDLAKFFCQLDSGNQSKFIAWAKARYL